MAAAMNGMALHKGLIPFAGTFLVFTDYARPAIRLGALMQQQVIHVMTHDSIGLGEDGPKRWEPNSAMREADAYKAMKESRKSEENEGDTVDEDGDTTLSKLLDTLRKGKKDKKKDKKDKESDCDPCGDGKDSEEE